jgi:Derlin-2/3
MGGGDGGIVGQAGFPLETWFWEMPLCTRWWTTATVLTSALVQCQIVTPFKLFYSYRAVFHQHQVSNGVVLEFIIIFSAFGSNI